MWFPAHGDAEGDSVRDLRSGDQVPADATIWTPPAADLDPTIVRVT